MSVWVILTDVERQENTDGMNMSCYHAVKGLMKILCNRPGGALGGRGAYWKGGIYNFNFIYLLIFFFSFLISYIFLSLFFFFIFFSHFYFHFSFEGGEHWIVEHWEGRGLGSRALGGGALGVVEHWEWWSIGSGGALKRVEPLGRWSIERVSLVPRSCLLGSGDY